MSVSAAALAIVDSAVRRHYTRHRPTQRKNMVTAFSTPRGWIHKVQSNMQYLNIDVSIIDIIIINIIDSS